ncbi:conserved hypothetical protein [Streptomyces himastatinicus ATCC 53653]|uniref:Uncharacterized protein n=2 Tax=Streptomyces violaceusniger group TaxID=2839105 RepID=D9WL83_9ACTN|nr:conserved hypothetical protein [Streptomyces himastatinicus ATCC 53653]
MASFPAWAWAWAARGEARRAARGPLDDGDGSCHLAFMTQGGTDHEALALALDHAWHWYENRRGRAYQVLNALLVLLAVAATAYAAALNADMHGAAAVISLLAGVVLAGAYSESMRLQASALLAEDVIKKVQEHLAATLNIDCLRLIEREHALHQPSRLRWMHPVSRVLVFIGVLASLGGAIYTWLATP